jgi:hypothetical protein
MRASWRRHIAIGSAATLLVLGACGDDDDDDAAADEPATEAGAPEDEVAAFCDAIDGMGLGVSIGEGYEGMDEALEAAEEVAPEEISADVTAMADENRAQVAAGPPPEGSAPPLPPDEFFAASTAVGDYIADSCDYPVLDVTATDHAFEGIPAEAEEGKTLVRLTNDGAEYHEVLFHRVATGEARSADELMGLPESEAGPLLTYVGNAFAPPGLGSWTIVDLAAARHIAVCYVPIGSTTADALRAGQAEQAPAHHTEGMTAEMQVS